MVRETFGEVLDAVLTLLDYAGAPAATVAEVRGVFRRYKGVWVASFDVIAAWERPTEDFSPAEMDAAIGRLKAEVHATAGREATRV